MFKRKVKILTETWELDFPTKYKQRLTEMESETAQFDHVVNHFRKLDTKARKFE